jgi:hypothetical protein
MNCGYTTLTVTKLKIVQQKKMRNFIRNFTKIHQEMWNVQAEICLRPVTVTGPVQWRCNGL